MTIVRNLAAAIALFAVAGPAAAYSTRYEVRHYPAAFTRTVNDVLGSHDETYADGSVTIDFGTNPAPSLSVAATQTGTTGFDIDASYEFAVNVVPISAAAQALFVAIGKNPTHIKIAEATGLITITEPKAVGTRITADVGQGGFDFNVGCENGTIGQCKSTRYHTALFVDAAARNPYLCGRTCPVVPVGTAITLNYSLITHVQVYGGPGSTAALLIDPVITLDDGFLRDNGLTLRDFSIAPEAGFGNTGTAAVPEPASWLLMILGFGLVGAIGRRRTTVTA